ncbi:MAG: allantoinase AllB [Ignavibacteriaceae bacterium]|nr:allantoinase AllB [Ignavibacteriaceae bacterium]
MKNLKNIFINTRDNFVRLAEIHFTDKIAEIKFAETDEIHWEQINSIDKLTDYIKPLFPGDALISAEILDGNFMLAMPGAIDPHVHFNTPGFEFREDFEHASLAAACGGVTTIIDMPCTSIPPVTNKENFNLKLEALHGKSFIDFALWGGIGGDDLNSQKNIETQIFDLAENGVAGFKVYAISGMPVFKDLSYEQIETVAKIVKQTGKPLAVHAEDKQIVQLIQQQRIKNGANSWRDYTDSRSVEAEAKSIKQLAEIAERTGCKIHIVHLSSKKGMEIVSAYRKLGVNISAETCPHFLQFTQKDFEKPAIRNFLKTAPPVKNKEDKEFLWYALSQNEIEFVTTDHAGCDPAVEKSSGNFWEVYGGIPSVEHRVPFLFSEGFVKQKLSLEQTINFLSTNAAKFFQIENKGKLQSGFDADIALINLWESEIITHEKMHSKGKYTPFEGIRFNAAVEKTYLRGEIIYSRDDNFCGKIGAGKFMSCSR